MNINKSKPRWWTPYWIVLVVAIIIIGVVIPVFLNFNVERSILISGLFLFVLGLAYYVRVKPSIIINRIVYIVGFGFLFGTIIWMFLYASGFFKWMVNAFSLIEDEGVALSLVLCFGIGAILGELFGKHRNYKGPEQYSP